MLTVSLKSKLTLLSCVATW